MATQNLEDYSRRARTLKFGSNVVLGIVLFAVILVAANYIAYKKPFQLDLTRDKQYTVSGATEKLLKSLKDQATVTVYASTKDVPPDWRRQLNELEALLRRYRSISGGKLTYVLKDPSAAPEAAEEARKAGISQQQMQQVAQTQLSFALGYLGFTVQYKGKTEIVPAIKPGTPLEYQLTMALNKVSETDVPTVAVLAPQGNPFMGEQSPFSLVTEVLQYEGYTVKAMEPGNLADLTSDVKVLMVLEPEDLTEEALYRIDQFVMGGGSLFVAASGIQIQGGPRGNQMRATPKAPNINSILENYGLRINPDVVEDWSFGVEQALLTQRGIVQTVNPFLIRVQDLSDTSPITRKLSGIAMLYPSSVSQSDLGTSGTYMPLAQSSQRSKHQTDLFVLEPFQVPRPGPETPLQSFDLVAQVSGKLKSRFAVVEPPTLKNDDGTTRAVADSEIRKTSEGNPTVIVAGSGVSFLDQIVGQQGSPNGAFVLNVADAMVRGGQYIALRNKEMKVTFLRDRTEREAVIAQIIVMGAVPLLLVAFGIGMYYYNRARKARYRAQFARPAAAAAPQQPVHSHSA